MGEVEAKLAELRGAPLVLSTRDWERVRGWRRQGIPLPVVLRALMDVLGEPQTAGHASRGLRPRSLAYCERAVQQRWNSQREAWVGRSSPASAAPGRLRSALNAVARQLEAAARRARHSARAALVPALKSLASNLRTLARELATRSDPLAHLAAALPRAEQSLHDAIRSALAADWARLLECERRRLRESLSGMREQAARATVEAALLRRLREELGVPVFDLGAVQARAHTRSTRRRLTPRPGAV